MTVASLERKKSRRGFAAMHPELARKIASLGGKAAHIKGTAHEFSSKEAKAAGRKGGAASAAKRKALNRSQAEQSMPSGMRGEPQPVTHEAAGD